MLRDGTSPPSCDVGCDQEADAAKWCSMLHGREVRQKDLLLESRGRWVVRVVERRRVVVLPGLFRPWG